MKADHVLTNADRHTAKEVVKGALERFKDMPPMQQLKFADLVADEIMGAVITLMTRPS